MWTRCGGANCALVIVEWRARAFSRRGRLWAVLNRFSALTIKTAAQHALLPFHHQLIIEQRIMNQMERTKYRDIRTGQRTLERDESVVRGTLGRLR
jgi:hypothetical protein